MGLTALSGLTACAPSLPLQSLQSVSNTISQSLIPAAVGKGSAVEIAARRREFAAPSQVAFASAMSIAQDGGFRLQSADISTGLITGVGSSSRRLNLGLAGLSETFRSPILSIQIEAISAERTEVRVTLAEGTNASAGSIGEQAVRDPAAYEQLFAMLNDEIIRRTNLSSALSSAPRILTLNKGITPRTSPLIRASDHLIVEIVEAAPEVDISGPATKLEDVIAEPDEREDLTPDIPDHGQATA